MQTLYTVNLDRVSHQSRFCESKIRVVKPRLHSEKCGIADRIQSAIDKPSVYANMTTCVPPTYPTMPNNRPEDLSPPELFLLKSAARLLGAVRWLEEHPPPPEKWDFLNKKVREEIVSNLDIDLWPQIDCICRYLLVQNSRHMHWGQTHLVCIPSSK